jgi:hypothetical protein
LLSTLAIGMQTLWRGYFARRRFYINLERLLDTGADASVVCQLDINLVGLLGAEDLSYTGGTSNGTGLRFDEATLDISRRAQLRRCVSRAVDLPLERVRILSVRDFQRRHGARVAMEVIVQREDTRAGGGSSGSSRMRADALAQELASSRFALNLSERLLDLEPPLIGFAQDSAEVQSVAVLLLGEL